MSPCPFVLLSSLPIVLVSSSTHHSIVSHSVELEQFPVILIFTWNQLWWILEINEVRLFWHISNLRKLAKIAISRCQSHWFWFHGKRKNPSFSFCVMSHIHQMWKYCAPYSATNQNSVIVLNDDVRQNCPFSRKISNVMVFCQLQFLICPIPKS